MKLGKWRFELGQTQIAWVSETGWMHDEPEGASPLVEDRLSSCIPEHRDRIRQHLQTCLQAGVPFDELLQTIGSMGQNIWVRVTGKPVRDDAGCVVALEGEFQDISDLEARHKSAELSERLCGALDSMSDAFLLLDAEWRFCFLNIMAEKLVQRSRDQLLGRVVWDLFPEAEGAVRARYERALAEGRLVRFEEYYSRLESWYEITVDPTPQGLAVYFRDISLQRARETQLRLLAAVAERVNDIVVITEAEPIDAPDGPKIVYVNDAFERRTGFSREEAIGKTPRILQGPKTQRKELNRIRNAMNNWQSVRSELVNYTKFGEEFWLELDIVPIADEKGWFTHWGAIERDITDRRQAEAALRLREERFRLLTNATGAVIFEANLITGDHWWSEGLEDVFGYSVERMTATPTIWHSNVHPDDLARVDVIGQFISRKRSFFRDKYRFRRADGTWATIDGFAFALMDGDGNVERLLGSMTDITEKALLEERLHQAQKMEVVGQLTGGVAHDFNNLLTIILGNAEILQERLVGDLELQDLARMTLDAADRGAELTSQLLAFSRRQPLEPKTIDVAKLIQGMDGLLRRTLPENINLEFIRSGGLWAIEADTSQLESALLNLAVNARDAMPQGGCLTIEAANAMLDDDYVYSEPDVAAGQYVVIIVTDTGVGISRDIVGKVFEPFFTTKEAGKGSGLGLSMVFGFVKQSGGHIRVYSEPGEGTVFKLYFPRSQRKNDRVVIKPTVRKAVGGTETILVVEDDQGVRDHVSQQLRSLGYQVLEASMGKQAVEVLRQTTKVDLLFTDVVMPGGMGGRELAEAARSIRPDIKVLFTSGYTENSIVHDGRLDHGVKLLSKPYRREQLASKVREVLDDNDSL